MDRRNSSQYQHCPYVNNPRHRHPPRPPSSYHHNHRETSSSSRSTDSTSYDDNQCRRREDGREWGHYQRHERSGGELGYRGRRDFRSSHGWEHDGGLKRERESGRGGERSGTWGREGGRSRSHRQEGHQRNHNRRSNPQLPDRRTHQQPQKIEDQEEIPKESLLRLPDLVGELTCEWLDRGTLLSLRLVCKKTKSWVESPRILKCLPVEIRTSKELQRVLHNSSISWNSFSILTRDLSIQSYIRSFIPRFCPQMRVLKITSLGGHEQKRDLLLASPNLEVLILSDINFRKFTPDQVEQLVKNGSNLQELQIQEITMAREEDISTFSRLSTTSVSLSILKLPIFQWESSIVVEPEEEVDRTASSCTTLKKTLTPNLIRYLLSRSSAYPQRPNVKIIDVVHTFSYNWMNSKYFEQLATACSQVGTRLLNVDAFTMPSNTGTKALDAIGSMHLSGFAQLSVPLDSLHNLKELKLTLSPMVRESMAAYNHSMQLELPSLETLDITSFCKGEEHIALILQVLLVKTQRGSVRTLKLAWNFDYDFPDNYIDSNDLVRNFPNLKVLHLFQYSGGDVDFMRLFEGMHKLEGLKLKDCRNLTDNAFVGSGRIRPSPFVTMNNLKSLWIRSFGARVTDRSFKLAFWKLSLQHFTFCCVGSPSLSLEGLSTLQRHPFGRSIQYLDVTRPPDLPDWQIRLMCNGLPNLKRSSI